MALIVHTNDGSYNTGRNFSRSTKKLGRLFDRLPSGLNIQRQTDDFVGLSLAAGMTTQLRDTNGAIRNTNDAISSVQVADDALVETLNALRKIRDLALQGRTNDSIVVAGADLQREINRMVGEIQRISLQTKFNDQKVVNGSFAKRKFQVGVEGNQTLVVTINAASVGALGLNSTQARIYSRSGTIEQMQSMAAGLIARVDTALDSISDIRTDLGIYQSRFKTIINHLSRMEANTQLAQSRICDADMAEETAKLTRNAIVDHSGIGIMAQANQQAQIAMQLLS
ncbi:MAG: flagellin FliC [Magnetococcales bacterium]|nr:flagellin FliC [Magnetococcales bacterium]